MKMDNVFKNDETEYIKKVIKEEREQILGHQNEIDSIESCIEEALGELESRGVKDAE